MKSFPPDAHWFCPKRRDDDAVDYNHPDESEEDMSAETKREYVADGKRRRDFSYRYSIVLGLSEEFRGEQDKYIANLHQHLKVCDKCVINWHMGRKGYLKELQE